MDVPNDLKSSHYPPARSNAQPMPLRVNPKYPLPSSLPPQDWSPLSLPEGPQENGAARTTSRRRRVSGKGQTESTAQPIAPEVPKPPPIAYRDPYGNALPHSSTGGSGNSTSFAARVRAAPTDLLSARIPDDDYDPVIQNTGPNRRGSISRAPGALYAAVQSSNRAPISSSIAGPSSPPYSSNTTTPRQYQGPDTKPQRQTSTTAPPAKAADSAAYSVPRLNERRLSASVADHRSPLQKLEVKLNGFSKEEKRARIEEAEQELRESKAGGRPPRSGQGIDATQHRSHSRRASTGADTTSRDLPPEKTRGVQDRERVRTDQGISSNPRGDSERRQATTASQPARTRIPLNSGTDSRVPVSRDRTQQASGKPPKLPEPSQQSERGVRFQSQRSPKDLDSALGTGPAQLSRDPRIKVEAPGSASTTSGERRTVKDRSYQDQSVMGNRTSRQIPRQQKSPDDSAGESFKTKAVNSRDRIVADTSLTHTTLPSSKDLPINETGSRNVSGKEARRISGLNVNPRGAKEEQAQHKHHFSTLLHRNRHNAPLVDDGSTPRTNHPTEWRQGGTARLTPADFVIRNDKTPTQNAWWEGGGSGDRNASAKATVGNKHDASLDGNYEQPYGKEADFYSLQNSTSDPQSDISRDPVIPHVRQYVANDELQVGRRRDQPWLRGHGALPALHARNPQFGLSNTYSYSCPHLSEHDGRHLDHICKPYMSKELTQSMRSIRIRAAPPPAAFNPSLYLKCGPLLRYTGLKRDKLQRAAGSRSQTSTERETWRGSVLIVTVDAESTYTPVPVLQLFPEQIDLLPPPPQQVDQGSGHSLPPEYIDPIAGMPKLSRTGKTVYVKPVEDLEVQIDLSRVEDDTGLFEETRTAVVPSSYGQPSNLPRRDVSSSSSANTRTGRRDGPSRYQPTKGVRLHAERGVTFWRFNLEIELIERQVRVAYRINNSASVGFWVPARGQTMNIMFHSCNGFSMSVNPDHFSGPDPLWRDVLNSHQTRPFHVMIGGGDQIYNDSVMSQTTLFHEWLGIKNPHHKHDAQFSPAMQDELETFYLERYSMWFSQGLFGMANSQIPMVNMWDDHDIIDGFGSYPDHFMRSPVFRGVGTVAFKYYMLFQHQSIVDEGMADEPSWLLGAAPGPYIHEFSRSVFMFLGKHVAFLGLDCRTERKKDQILSEGSYHLAFDRCRREIIQGDTKHLIVLLGVPIAYPRLVWLENLLTSKAMDPIKAMGRAGMLGNFLNKFDGGVEILDDLDDHWTSRNHKLERNWFIQELQALAAEKSVRVTILGGDVHLAAVGQFLSSVKLEIPKDQDHRYMVNIISSAIVNTPPPEMMGDILNKRNKTHHLYPETDENMIPMFTHDVDGKPRNNKRLLPRRNWCSIREYHPGTTPPPTPPLSEPQTPSDVPPRPANRLQRTLSLTRNDIKPRNLIRRLSQRGPPPSMEYPISNEYRPSPPVGTSPPLRSSVDDGYFASRHSPETSPAMTISNPSNPLRRSSAPLARPGNFHRRPTNMSEKAARKGENDRVDGQINLQNGLDIVLNCEVSQKDPAGITVPYRLLIPMLWYDGQGDPNGEVFRKKSWISRLGSISKGNRKKSGLAKGQGGGEWGGNHSEESASESESESGRDDHRRAEVQTMSGALQGRRGSALAKDTQASRRSSKVDDMLGMAGPAEGRIRPESGLFGNSNNRVTSGKDDHSRRISTASGNGYGSPTTNVRTSVPRFEDNTDHDFGPEQGVVAQSRAKGYSGIEAYKESRWRRFF